MVCEVPDEGCSHGVHCETGEIRRMVGGVDNQARGGEKMEGELKILIGQCVDFVDPYGKAHEGLVTAIHGDRKQLENGEWTPVPSINVVFVSDDHAKTDQYGRQLERYTSVVHESNQSAHGMFWREVG